MADGDLERRLHQVRGVRVGTDEVAGRGEQNGRQGD